MFKILVLYDHYYPDDVVSALLYADFCDGLFERGWDVEIWPSNRACHNPEKTYSLKSEVRNGVLVRRVWKPEIRQHTFLGRIITNIWVLIYWWLRLLFSPSLKPNVILTGSNPIFTMLLSPLLKFLRPNTRIAHWCYDLYPEVAIADGLVGEKGIFIRAIRFLLKWAYRSCDLVVDLGSCMRGLLTGYSMKSGVTLTPWALEEPSEPLHFDPSERKELFGESTLGLLYSGSFGRAHDYVLTLKLARLMRISAVFTFSARGSRLDELKQAVNPEDTNIHFAPFAPPDRLSVRLSAPDVHVVSLRSEWSGMVVPSKFFGALAAGRPVLFEGSETSDIAKWIKEYGVGWVLKSDNLDSVAKELIRFSKDQKQKTAIFKHCHSVYQTHFSKKSIVGKWNLELKSLIAR